MHVQISLHFWLGCLCAGMTELLYMHMSYILVLANQDYQRLEKIMEKIMVRDLVVIGHWKQVLRYLKVLLNPQW